MRFREKQRVRPGRSGVRDLVSNPIEDRPAQGRKAVIGKAGGVVAERTLLSRPDEPEVGIDAVPPQKKAVRSAQSKKLIDGTWTTKE